MPVFDLIELPYCKVIRIGAWNEPAHRYFIAYRAEGTFRQVMGLPVVDEFATFSSPLFFSPESILGKIYNAGISLAHLRDPEMGIDQGWPPLCVGTRESGQELPKDWEKDLLEKITAVVQRSGGAGVKVVDGYQLQKTQVADIDVYATDAPLLPKQLKRICQLSRNPFSIAFSIGNKLTPPPNAVPHRLRALSEATLAKILEVLAEK